MLWVVAHGSTCDDPSEAATFQPEIRPLAAAITCYQLFRLVSADDACALLCLFIAVIHWIADMERSLIWMESDVNGWACSNCQWRFPVPTLLSGEEAKGAYDRLAAAKFRQHTCEPSSSFSSAMPEAIRNADSALTERARTLIKRGYKPKVAVELALQEMEIEHGNNPKIMEKARADADDFLQRVRKGLI